MKLALYGPRPGWRIPPGPREPARRRSPARRGGQPTELTRGAPLPSRAIRLGRGIAGASDRPSTTQQSHGLRHIRRRAHRRPGAPKPDSRERDAQQPDLSGVARVLMGALSVDLRSGPPLRPEELRTRWTVAGGNHDVITAAPGLPPPAPSQVTPSERRHAATVVDCNGAVPRPAGGHLPAPRRRSPALPGDSPLTPTSFRSSGTPSASRATPRQRGARLPPRTTALGPQPPARQGPHAPPQAGSTAATTPRCRVRRSARRASYGANSRTSFSPADTTPTLFRLLVRRVPVLPRGLGRAQRAAASSALRTARGLPHLVGIVPALPPRQRHARAVRPPPLLRAHAGPPGLQLPIVRGARGHAPRRG